MGGTDPEPSDSTTTIAPLDLESGTGAFQVRFVLDFFDDEENGDEGWEIDTVQLN